MLVGVYHTFPHVWLETWIIHTYDSRKLITAPPQKKTNCSLSPVMGELQIWSESYGWYQPEWSSSVFRSPRIPSINSTSIALRKARLGLAAFGPPRIYSHEISQLVGWFPLRSIIPVTPDWSRYLFHPDVWTFILRKLLRQWDMKSLVKSLIDKYQFGHLFRAIPMVSIYGWWIPISGIPMVTYQYIYIYYIGI